MPGVLLLDDGGAGIGSGTGEPGRELAALSTASGLAMSGRC